jgi:hypothetical protein
MRGDMGTYVRMYVIYARSAPHIMLDSGGTLDGIATALSARRGADLIVCWNQDGHSRGLNEAELREVEERVRELRLLAGEG